MSVFVDHIRKKAAVFYCEGVGASLHQTDMFLPCRMLQSPLVGRRKGSLRPLCGPLDPPAVDPPLPTAPVPIATAACPYSTLLRSSPMAVWAASVIVSQHPLSRGTRMRKRAHPV